MNNQEPGFISDQRLRAYYVRIGFITPARNWESELAEYESSRNTPNRRPGQGAFSIVNRQEQGNAAR